MFKMNATWVAVVALALAATSACKKKETSPPATTPADAASASIDAAAEPAPSPDAAPAAAASLPEPLAKFKAALDPVVAAPAGVERAKAGCAAKLFDLTEDIRDLPAPAGVDEATWVTATKALSGSALSVDDVCTGDGGGPEGATDVILKGLTDASEHLQAIIALLPK